MRTAGVIRRQRSEFCAFKSGAKSFVGQPNVLILGRSRVGAMEKNTYRLTTQSKDYVIYLVRT